MSDESAQMWREVHTVNDRVSALAERLARVEEQGVARSATLEEMRNDMRASGKKLDALVKLIDEAQTAARVSMLFGKWGYGLITAMVVAIGSYFHAPWLMKVLKP